MEIAMGQAENAAALKREREAHAAVTAPRSLAWTFRADRLNTLTHRSQAAQVCRILIGVLPSVV